MNSLLFISDVVLDPFVKELKQSRMDGYEIDLSYEEDIISRLLSIDGSNAAELDKYDLIFLHSDQLYHQKDQAWQKMYCRGILNLSSRFGKRILLSNSFSRSFNAMPLKLSAGKVFDTAEVYSNSIKELQGKSNVFIFDFYNSVMSVGLKSFYNYNLGHLYQMPYTKPALKVFAADFAEQTRFLFAEEKKVIVIDCDNTLWKGIIGEDGIDGIVCDKNADGILHYNLQLFLKAKKDEGFLLCICSRNNEPDVKEVFEKKNFPLQWKDFIIKKINWGDKANNITEIATELNLGTDSFIFIDDNLFEINSISEMLKGVSCVHVTGKYEDLLTAMDSFIFRRKQILKDDVEKTKQYELEMQRKEVESTATSFDDFLAGLDIRLDMRVNDVNDFTRLAQMTGKTNQFNFNKREYNESEMQAFIQKGRVYSLKVADKYGDYGTVGLIMAQIDNGKAIIENYLMSCRALGKRIEFDFYDQVVTSLQADNIIIQDIRFKKTEKNIPAQTFLKSIQYGHKAE